MQGNGMWRWVIAMLVVFKAAEVSRTAHTLSGQDASILGGSTTELHTRMDIENGAWDGAELGEATIQPQLPVVPPADIAFRRIDETDTRITPPTGSFPADLAAELFRPAAPQPAPLPPTRTFSWTAPEIWWHPLYFDDVPLERYGQSPAPRLQPALSGAQFFLMLPIMPYKMTVDPPRARKTNVGYYRPGSPMPCVGRRLPRQADAAAVEAATWVGLIFLLP